MRNEIAAYLRSVSGLYPGGIPRSMFGNRNGAKSASQPSITFLWRAPVAPDPFADDAGQLLRAAIEKGLKLSVDAVRVVREEDPARLSQELSSDRPGIVVLLGPETAAAAGVDEIESGVVIPRGERLRVLKTLDLPSILSDQGRKKVFWSHLQLILKQLQAGTA